MPRLAGWRFQRQTNETGFGLVGGVFSWRAVQVPVTVDNFLVSVNPPPA